MTSAYAAPALPEHAESLRLLAQFCSVYAAGELGVIDTPIEGVVIMRATAETEMTHTLLRPAICIVAQGAKWTSVGNNRFTYRPGDALVVSADLPTTGRIIEASAEAPYVAVAVELDLAIMRDVMETIPRHRFSPDGLRGLFVTKIDEKLADAVLRLARLIETPEAITALRPAIMREISYWLLAGPHGSEIARVALGTDHVPHVISAIHALRDRYAESIRVEDLANAAQMSLSAFHRQFKAVTSMTPLQYQKKLRLLEARRLLTVDATNVETAAYRVGYESASQFSREYSRMFGTSPGRDARRGEA
jgi:AraC-like DNA-binding protein